MIYKFLANSKKTEKVNFLKLLVLLCLFLFCFACNTKEDKKSNVYPFITSSEPIRIVSVNDGGSIQSLWNNSRHFPNSVSVIELSPDKPPFTKTVENAAPNTFAGAPYGATISNGRYVFIPNHPFGAINTASDESSIITVLDLDSDTLSKIKTFEMPNHVWQVMSHPDDKRVIAISAVSYTHLTLPTIYSV